jgi:hypothetical protein
MARVNWQPARLAGSNKRLNKPLLSFSILAEVGHQKQHVNQTNHTRLFQPHN